MKKVTFLIYVISIFGYSQTPITDANLYNAVSTCLSTNPVDGLCSSSEYGAMPDWDVSQVTDLSSIFTNKRFFNADISAWDVSNVTNTGHMFKGAYDFNQDINAWDMSSVTNMSEMFYSARSFNQDVSTWDVSNVDSMRSMFRSAVSFDQDIGPWDVSAVTDMNYMLAGTTSFNQDISDWDVTSVDKMEYLFWSATSFDQDISSWEVGSVTKMKYLFSYATSFNQDISSWDVSNVTSMLSMFWDATSFNQDLSAWDVSSVYDMGLMFWKSDLSTENYDAILTGWSTLNLQQDVSLGARDINYCVSHQERQSILDTFNWSIDDAGLESVDCSLGIDEANSHSFSIYPNPTNSMLFIENNKKPVAVSIYDLSGKKLLSAENTNKMNVKKLPNGVYIIHMNDGIRQTNKKFVKF